MEVLKKIENNFRYFDLDSHADPPSKSEPPSALFNDEPLSASFFHDLESPGNHPPLRFHHQSFQGKSKEEMSIEHQAEAVELASQTFDSRKEED